MEQFPADVYDGMLKSALAGGPGLSFGQQLMLLMLKADSHNFAALESIYPAHAAAVVRYRQGAAA
jgi:hypothetical protein